MNSVRSRHGSAPSSGDLTVKPALLSNAPITGVRGKSKSHHKFAILISHVFLNFKIHLVQIIYYP
jgi:hypothetical protein